MYTRALESRRLELVGFIALLLWAGVAKADPGNGFGLYFGAIHSSDSNLYGTSHGASFGVDAQMAVNEDWSLNPYLAVTSESTDAGYNAENLSAGLQARRWFDHWFIAGEFLERSLLIHNTPTLYGPAAGLAAGWEADNHWSVELEANAFERSSIGGSSIKSDRSDVRLLVGYHWY